MCILVGYFGHHVVVFFIEPSATANVKQNLMTSNREVMKHTLTGKAIGARTISAVWLMFVLVKINVNYLCVVLFSLHIHSANQTSQACGLVKGILTGVYIFHLNPVVYLINVQKIRLIVLDNPHVFASDPFFIQKFGIR